MPNNKNKFIPIKAVKSPKSGKYKIREEVVKTKHKNQTVVNKLYNKASEEFYKTINRLNLLKNLTNKK